MRKLGIARLCLFSLPFLDAGSVFALEHHPVEATKIGNVNDWRAVTLDLERCKGKILRTVDDASPRLALWEEATGNTELVAEDGNSYSTEVPMYKRRTNSGVEVGFSLDPSYIFEHFNYVRPTSADSVLLDTKKVKELGGVFAGETISLKRVFSLGDKIDVIIPGKNKIIFRQNSQDSKFEQKNRERQEQLEEEQKLKEPEELTKKNMDKKSSTQGKRKKAEK